MHKDNTVPPWGEARTHNPSISSLALYHCATELSFCRLKIGLFSYPLKLTPSLPYISACYMLGENKAILILLWCYI